MGFRRLIRTPAARAALTSSSPLSLSPPSLPPLPQQHDVLSAGVGSLAVTTFCVLKGQDPATALSITAAATVAALVADDLLFSGGRGRSGPQ